MSWPFETGIPFNPNKEIWVFERGHFVIGTKIINIARTYVFGEASGRIGGIGGGFVEEVSVHGGADDDSVRVLLSEEVVIDHIGGRD